MWCDTLFRCKYVLATHCSSVLFAFAQLTALGETQFHGL